LVYEAGEVCGVAGVVVWQVAEVQVVEREFGERGVFFLDVCGVVVEDGGWGEEGVGYEDGFAEGTEVERDLVVVWCGVCEPGGAVDVPSCVEGGLGHSDHFDFVLILFST
jgi:hypothetical protein